MHRGGHLQARAGYNGTETTISVPVGTGVLSPEEDTFTVTQTNTKFVTLAYTLGNGVVKTTIITKVRHVLTDAYGNQVLIFMFQTEESVQTTAHVQSTFTVTPIVKLSTFVPSLVSVASVASSAKSKSTSTRTLVVTVAGSETTTVNIAAFAAASSASPACSVQTVSVPQYVTLYSTVVSIPHYSS